MKTTNPTASFTPGPWIANTLPDGTLEILGDQALPVAVTAFYRNGSQQANARLIASAPDLLRERDELRATLNRAEEANGAMRSGLETVISRNADLLAALEALLDQVTGPAQVFGNGCGSDGKKTGLSGQEFNARTDSRIDQARAAILKAKGLT